MRRPLTIALVCVTGFLGCVEDEKTPAPTAPTTPVAESPLRCPPCGMRMDPDTPLREIAGSSWAVCNERCAELIAEEPELFREFAVNE